MGNKKNYYFLIFLLAAPVIIYFYYLKWKTNTIYGDDLYIFMNHSGPISLGEKINLDILSGKYRPIHGVTLHWIIELFGKNLQAYYCFNVAIQAINTFIFAIIFDLLLNVPIVSCLLSLVWGLSRFSYYVISQLLNGGCLEGMAMTFFLLFLYCLVKVFVNADSAKNNKHLLWSIIWANLCLYTHERYVILLPFIILVLFFFPALKEMSFKKRSALSSIALGSLALNVLMKKCFYSIPFFLGTSNATITFSYSSAMAFFRDAILSIVQINSGPEYTAGFQFQSLPKQDKEFVFVLVLGVLVTLCLYVVQLVKYSKAKSKHTHFPEFILLAVLFILLIVPGTVTIRFEQRWLQAPFCVFLVMLVIALRQLQMKKTLQLIAYTAFSTLFIWSNYRYFSLGVNNYFMNQAENMVYKFKEAAVNGVIRPATSKLYILDYKDVNGKDALTWYLAQGYFFNFYQGKSKQIAFIDSSDLKQTPLISFNTDSTQVVTVTDKITDITTQIK